MVGSISFELKSKVVSLGRMTFIANNLDYLYMGSMMDFHACVTLSCNSYHRGCSLNSETIHKTTIRKKKNERMAFYNGSHTFCSLDLLDIRLLISDGKYHIELSFFFLLFIYIRENLKKI